MVIAVVLQVVVVLVAVKTTGTTGCSGTTGCNVLLTRTQPHAHTRDHVYMGHPVHIDGVLVINKRNPLLTTHSQPPYMGHCSPH